MKKKKPYKPPKEIIDALKRFPRVWRLNERRAIERRRFLKKVFGKAIRDMEKIRSR